MDQTNNETAAGAVEQAEAVESQHKPGVIAWAHVDMTAVILDKDISESRKSSGAWIPLVAG